MKRFRTLALLASIGMFVVPALSWSSSSPKWTGFRGEDGTGRAVGVVPPGDGAVGFELRWKQAIGSGYAGIAVADGRLVTAFQSGERDVVAAFDQATGAELWRHDLGPTYRGHDGSHDGPVATPAIVDGRVFALGAWGEVAALEAATGEVVWSLHLVDDLGCEKPHYGFSSSPVVVDGRLVLQVGGEAGALVALDVASGEVLWWGLEDGVFAQSPIVTELAGTTQVVTMGMSQVAGIDPATGDVLWSIAHGAERSPMGAMSQSPLPLPGDRLLVKHSDSSIMVLAVSRADDGFEVEQVVAEARGMNRSYSPPTVWGDAVYGYTARFLSAFDPGAGELLWRSREPGDGFLVAADGQLLVLTKEGSLSIGPASSDGWSESATLDVFDDLSWSPPSVDGSSLYLRSFGEIARVDLVRSEPTAAKQVAELPEALRALDAQLASAADPDAAVSSFLEHRELPLVDGDEVTFLWHGTATDVAIAGDMIGVRREEPMRRLGATDLWWWSTRIDPHNRVSYVFFVDYEPTVDPSHGRRVTSTVVGPDMNWRRETPLEMSWFGMPEWPGHASAVTVMGGRLGRLEALEVSIDQEEGDPVAIPIQVWLPDGYDDTETSFPVVFVHNPYARTEGQWPATLGRVVETSVRPMIVVFVEAPRIRGYDEAFVEWVAPEIDERFRTSRDRDERANIGMGWQAQAAAAIALGNTDQFGVLGIQSFFALDIGRAAVEAAFDDQTAPTTPLRVYLEWGRWDVNSPHEAVDIAEASRKLWEMFESRGWEPMGGEVWDSTDFAGWRVRTDVLLESLFPVEGDGPAAGLKAWQAAGR